MGTFLLMMGIFILVILLGIPVGFSIGLSVLVILLLNDVTVSLIAQATFTGLNTYAFLAIPMFIFAGLLMERGGISKRLIKLAMSLVGNIHGGLGIITIFACMFFGAISGSAAATIAAIGSMMIPAMERDGYDVNFAGAITASAGSLGILIPPSVTMIIYAIIAEVSIGEMFLAGFIPGMLISSLLAITTYIIAKKKGYRSPQVQKLNFRESINALLDAKWALMTPLIILGGIYSGIFTPTESAVIAVIYALFVGLFVHKEFTLKEVFGIAAKAGITTAVAIVILGFAMAFARYLTIARIPQQLAEIIITYADNLYSVYFIFIALTLFCGTFMAEEAMILIFTPIFLPVLESFGVSPIHFGIMFVGACQLAMLTPPVGAGLFVAQTITGTSLIELSKKIGPFLLALVIGQVLMVIFPNIVLFLPNLIYNK